MLQYCFSLKKFFFLFLALNLSPPHPSLVQTLPLRIAATPTNGSKPSQQSLCRQRSHKLCATVLRLSAALHMVDHPPTWNACSGLLWHHVFWAIPREYFWWVGRVLGWAPTSLLSLPELEFYSTELGSFFSLHSEFQLIFPTLSRAFPLTCPHRCQSQLDCLPLWPNVFLSQVLHLRNGLSHQ